MEIKKIGIIANVEKEKSREHVLSLRNWLKRRGLEVFLEKGLAELAGEDGGIERKSLVAAVDLLVVFGGDGTILRTARFAVGFATPIIGINLGDFGYLTEVNLNEMYSVMEIILRGEGRTDRRMMLDAAINDQEEGEGRYTALNDVVINRANLSRIIELETYEWRLSDNLQSRWSHSVYAHRVNGLFSFCRRSHRVSRSGCNNH